jgi:glucuronate isomerase
MDPLVLHDDRYFDPDPTVRRLARSLYDETRDLPIVSPHGHVDPRLLAEDEPFPEPASLIVRPDHYVFRMLYSQGVPLEDLGIPTRDGTPVEDDPRAIWQRFADHYPLFNGTPTGAWLDYEMAHVFGVRRKLTGASATDVYDTIHERLQEPDFRPRALYDRFGIEVLCTTDAATDDLRHHRTLRNSDWDGTVRPTFRPDALLAIAADDWPGRLDALREACGASIGDHAAFVDALEQRRSFFKEMGAVATDHAVRTPRTHALSDREADALFQKALRGEATREDEAAFQAHMLMEMARMSTEDGLVMQIHPGSFRNHNQALYERFGPDVGADIPVRTEFTRNLHELLNAYGNDPNLTVVLFTLDETTYARELAPLAGHYPCLKLGPAWWFHDSLHGMMRYRRRTIETAGIHNTAGFNDDTRAFCSIPARHDLSRRVDANYLARRVARHVLDLSDARRMARALATGLARETYNLEGDDPKEDSSGDVAAQP